MIAVEIDKKKLAGFVSLKSGNTRPNEDGKACVMEAVAYVAGEPWSDHPACTCPIITAFMVSWNDALPTDADRSRLLLPLIPHLVGTRGGKALETRRATMAADWMVRVYTPAWLRLAGLAGQADLLTSLPEITAFAETPSLMPVLLAVRDAASAAESAARSAARSAAMSAAESAAESAARSAAWSAARSAAESAARSAARSAAWSALSGTISELQDSAVNLVIRMCAEKDAS